MDQVGEFEVEAGKKYRLVAPNKVTFIEGNCVSFHGRFVILQITASNTQSFGMVGSKTMINTLGYTGWTMEEL